MADSPRLTRRETLIAGTALTAVASPILPSAAQGGVSTLPPEDTGVALHVNGKGYELQLDARVTLLDTLRERLGLFGTK